MSQGFASLYFVAIIQEAEKELFNRENENIILFSLQPQVNIGNKAIEVGNMDIFIENKTHQA